MTLQCCWALCNVEVALRTSYIVIKPLKIAILVVSHSQELHCD